MTVVDRAGWRISQMKFEGVLHGGAAERAAEAALGFAFGEVFVDR